MSEDTTPPSGETREDAAAQTGGTAQPGDAAAQTGPPSESGQGASGEPQPEKTPDAAGEDAGPQTVPLAALPAADLLASFLSLMAMKAWEGMGLVPNPLTSKTQKNLDDARLAIDAYASVFELLRSRIEEQPRREMENVLTMLRVNFVDKSAG